MREVCKFPLSGIPDRLPRAVSLQVPAGMRPLFVGIQEEHVCLWADVDPDRPTVAWAGFIIGTGQAIPPGCRYLGTVLVRDTWVLHVLEEGTP
jgi:hypothetical protein